VFLDSGPLGGPWGDPAPRTCKSCRQPILQGEPTQEIEFPPEGESAEMSGTYHSACARPFQSLAHALAMLGRPLFQ
jgi:hypothetical protein